MTQTLPATTTIDWWANAAFHRHDQPDAGSNTHETHEKENRRSLAGRVAALLGHTGRALLHSFIEGLAQHGAAHHGFPHHHRHGEDSDDT